MSDENKKPYMVVCHALDRADCTRDIRHLTWLVSQMEISEGHERIFAAIEAKEHIQDNTYMRTDLDLLKQAVLASKGETEKFETGKASQVTDADNVDEDARHTAILALREKMRTRLREIADDGHRFLATFELYADVFWALAVAKTKEEFQRANRVSSKLE